MYRRGFALSARRGVAGEHRRQRAVLRRGREVGRRRVAEAGEAARRRDRVRHRGVFQETGHRLGDES